MVPQMMPQMRPMPVMHPMAMQRPPFGKFRPCLRIALCADKCILIHPLTRMRNYFNCILVFSICFNLAMPLTLNLEINIDDNEESEFGGRYRKFCQTIARSNCKIIRINELSNSAKSCATLIGL